jgi:hypothetical protein
MSDLQLIYVLPVGKNWKEEYIYEFIFSDDISNVDGEDWDSYPASGKPSAPHKSLIKAVGKLTSEMIFDVVQNSDTFAVYDAVDGVIALAWENIDDYDQYPESRICFRFGDDIKKVKDTLYSKDITLEIKEIKNELKR